MYLIYVVNDNILIYNFYEYKKLFLVYIILT